jgi:hypothetical protein
MKKQDKEFLANVWYDGVLEDDVYNLEDTQIDNDWFVVDLCGKMHQITDSKVASIRKSMEYWRDKQDTAKGKQYYSNMRYVYQQILLLMEGNREVS